MGIKDKIFKEKQDIYRNKYYELTYIVEEREQERLSELVKKFKKINGWNEKEILQFAVTATQQADIDMKLKFLEGIIKDLEGNRSG